MSTTAHRPLLDAREAGARLHDVAHLPARVADPERLSALLARALGIGLREPGALRMRAFTGSTLDYRLHKALLEQPLQPGGSVCDWVAGRGGPASCVAVNGLAAWDLELAGWFIERVAELQAVTGGSLSTRQDSYAFISGGTGWTPFGIHEDYEPSLIFHLGPGPKRVWVWEPPGRPVGVVDGAPAFGGVSFRIDESLPSAREIVLRPGDVLNIPANVHHVFHNDGPSAFLGLSVHFPDPVRDAEPVLAALARRVGEAGVESAAALAAEFARRSGELEALQREREAELASAGYVDRPARRVLDGLGAGSGPVRLAHPGAVAAAGTTLYVRGRALRTSLAPEAAHRVATALRAPGPLDAASLAAGAGIGLPLATRLLAAVHRLGGLAPA